MRISLRTAVVTLVRRAALTVILSMLFIPTVGANAEVLGGAVVSADALYIRSEASFEASPLAVAPKDAVVVLIEKIDDSWYKTWYAGFVGYMASEFLEVTEEADGSLGAGTVMGTDVRVRLAPGADGLILLLRNEGDRLEVTGVNGAWYKVKYEGTAGFVHSDYLMLDEAEVKAGTSPRQGIIDTAMKYLGVPYVWAGTSPSGFDCSGFVYYVFSQNGYSTNRTAESLMQNGEYVDRNDLLPGDVIGFANRGGSYVGHCGIYLGDGQFIHSSSGTGDVTINTLETGYYANNYYTARRIAA